MIKSKKKTKAPAKKQSESSAKKTVKAKAGTKTNTKKRSKSLVSAKVSRVTSKKTKRPAGKPRKQKMEITPQEIPVTEALKQSEPVPTTAANSGLIPDTVGNHTIQQHQFQQRASVIMKQENQRIKSALASRHAAKRVFRTPR